MTREEKIAKARELRAEGKTAGEIALAVQAPESTVRNWYLGGNCEECGAPVDGGSGAGSSKHCPACAPAVHRKWTPERLVAKCREWARLYDEPPCAPDWSPAHPSSTPVSRERFHADEWPTSTTVRDHFGTWNALIRAAGFEPVPPHKRRRHRGERVAA